MLFNEEKVNVVLILVVVRVISPLAALHSHFGGNLVGINACNRLVKKKLKNGSTFLDT